jgi:FMN phosphatase YigB (HAD superfamily)
MESCKPSASFFTQVCGMIGCAPKDCVMVGDDADADMPASLVGIRTFYVGKGPARADGRGAVSQIPRFLAGLAEED